jgi:hypothetical protein
MGDEAAPPPDAGEASPPEPTPDAPALVDLFGDEAPDFLKDIPDGEYRVSKEELDEVVGRDPRIARILAGYRRLANGKANELAERSKATEAIRSALLGERARVNQLAEAFTKLTPEQEQAMQGPTGEAPDPFTPEGRDWYAKKQLAEGLTAFFGGFQKTATSQITEAHTALAEQAAQARLGEVEAFVAKTGGDSSEFYAYGDAVLELQAKYGGPTKLHPIAAFHMAKGQVAAGQRAAPKAAKAATSAVDKARAESRRAAPDHAPQPVPGRVPPTPKNVDEMTLAEFYATYPSAMDRDAREAESWNGSIPRHRR